MAYGSGNGSAVFLVRTAVGPGYTPPACTGIFAGTIGRATLTSTQTSSRPWKLN